MRSFWYYHVSNVFSTALDQFSLQTSRFANYRCATSRLGVKSIPPGLQLRGLRSVHTIEACTLSARARGGMLQRQTLRSKAGSLNGTKFASTLIGKALWMYEKSIHMRITSSPLRSLMLRAGLTD